ITYDSSVKQFYLGSIHLSKIIQFDATGKVNSFADASGSVLGMSIDPQRKLLWSATTTFTKGEKNEVKMEKSGVLQYDLQTKKLLHNFPVESAGEHALGDAIVDSKGNVYTTDSANPFVYWIPQGSEKLQPLVTSDQFRSLQGLCFSADQKKLFLADYSNGIF